MNGELRPLINLVGGFSRACPNTQATALAILLLVADEPGITTVDIRKALSLGQSSVSRNVGLLGNGHSLKGRWVEGYGFVNAVPCLKDNRTLSVYLSRKGQKNLGEWTEQKRARVPHVR